MIAFIKDNHDLMMQAYYDGELNPVSALEFERRLADDDALRTQYSRLLSLRSAVRSLRQYDVPLGLQARINSALNAEHPRQVERPRPRGWSFQALAAAAVFGAVISSFFMLTIDRRNLSQDVTRQVVASHIRSLLAPQPFDVASSDRHTVKPWFTSRLPESPPVIDLASQGFLLVGGRVDVVGHDPVATIVYRHAAHTVSLTTLRSSQSVSAQAIAGYNVRSWNDAAFTYIAVSDLPGDDLAAFERAFSAGSPAPEIK